MGDDLGRPELEELRRSEAAVAYVLAARLLPGFFLTQLAGVLADRWDRQRLMVFCDIGRAGVVCLFPFMTHVWQLVLLGLVLEAFTLLWIPSKEALVPNLLPEKHLPTANTLSLVATYGTAPLAIGLLFVFDVVSDDAANTGFWFDAGTFVIAAAIIWSINPLRRSPGLRRNIDADKFDMRSLWNEIRDGWKLVFTDPALRAVNIGLAFALIGGGMLVPLGRVYVDEVIGDGASPFTLLWGFVPGAVIGAVALLTVADRIDHQRMFGRMLLLAGLAFFAATSFRSLPVVIVLLGLVGASVVNVYVIGFTIIQKQSDDDTRGRVFAAFYSLSRVVVVLIVFAAPFVAVFFDRVTELTTNNAITIGGYDLLIPGVRITFWIAALLIVGAGVFAMRTLRSVPAADLHSVS